MDDFLTVEDANTLIYDNQEYWMHEIDIGKITTGNEDFTDVKYDFCRITRVFDNNQPQMKYIFTVKVDHSAWTGGVHINKTPNGLSSIEGGCRIVCEHYNLKLKLYMGQLWFGVSPLLFSLLSDSFSYNLKQLKSTKYIEYTYADGSSHFDQYVLLNKGYNLIKHSGLRVGYVYVNLLKTDFKFNCNQSLVIGKINKVILGADADYKPNGDFIGEYIPNIIVEYKDKIIPVSFDETLNDYAFNIDLTDISDASKVKFKVCVETNDVLNESITNVSLNSDYEVVSSYADLVSACNRGGAKQIKLGADITLSNSIFVQHLIKIYGDDHVLDLNNQSFILNEGIDFDVENVLFNNGNVAIKQSKNTNVNINNSIFNNCTGFGSCIQCNINYDSLEDTDDFNTSITNTLFTNNDLCIVHGGELTIDNCKYHNIDTNYIDKENVAFLYQLDGNANITNSIFDINYYTDELCVNEENIGFAQALLQCGVTARINGATANTLKQDNSLPFTSNRTHVFCKYYYSQIENCVYTSPTLNNEDKAVCYCVSNENWIYKQNVQVTRANSQNENRYNKIEWED